MASNSREAIAPPRDLLVSWLARLYRHCLTTTTGGNLSLIDDDGTMYITPSGGDKAIVPPENVACRKPDTDDFEGPCPPSIEWPLHTAAYRSRPECRAVLHAHSTTLVAFSLAQHGGDDREDGVEPLKKKAKIDWDPRIPDTRCLLGAWQSCGKVALAPYCVPGSDALAKACVAAFETGADCVILQNHGVVTVGGSMHQAYDRFVALEYLARSIVNAIPLQASLKPLPDRILQVKQDGVNIDQDSALPSPVDLCPAAKCCCQRQRVIRGKAKEIRAQLCKFVHRAYDQNLITSSSGSFSNRLPLRSTDNNAKALSFLVTPTNVDRRSLESTDLCYVSNELHCNHHHDTCTSKPTSTTASSISDTLQYHPIHHPDSPETVSPSRAAAIHSTIYSTHPQINSIIIVQPPFATSYCITGRPFNSAGIPESHIILRNVQTLPFESVLNDAGTTIADSLNPAMGQNTVLIEGYGLISIANDLLKAYVQLEVCESMCAVNLTALRRGPVALLSEEQVREIDVAFHI